MESANNKSTATSMIEKHVQMCIRNGWETPTRMENRTGSFITFYNKPLQESKKK